jgi:DNA mismatch repair protein MutS
MDRICGKSTFLKTVGICTYLGHLGVGIPTLKGEIPFTTIFLCKLTEMIF